MRAPGRLSLRWSLGGGGGGCGGTAAFLSYDGLLRQCAFIGCYSSLVACPSPRRYAQFARRPSGAGDAHLRRPSTAATKRPLLTTTPPRYISATARRSGRSADSSNSVGASDATAVDEHGGLAKRYFLSNSILERLAKFGRASDFSSSSSDSPQTSSNAVVPNAAGGGAAGGAALPPHRRRSLHPVGDKQLAGWPKNKQPPRRPPPPPLWRARGTPRICRPTRRPS
ncbi:hypothetical protein SPI_08429 [Niveomyces insectorum RCEF 264]|uniref:Uncharacterized protein n=1 Tax=Niveomyces insectorum RCEF 264 TaxID=1081102 RepID=A0A167NAU0_9HYPO|nr:hypothetical protein SPI_08429 [Niveomyces insectorum RCEF 264]